MGDPHNPKRAGETWKSGRIEIQLEEIRSIGNLHAADGHRIATLSGGWAWHFMSPEGHEEVKTQHDHKDVDLFVKPEDFEALRIALVGRGYRRARTRHDDPSGRFYRFTKHYESGKVVFDVFLEEAPSVEAGGFRVVEPKYLLSLYGMKHTSSECRAVQEARKLLERGIDPVGRSELVEGNDP